MSLPGRLYVGVCQLLDKIIAAFKNKSVLKTVRNFSLITTIISAISLILGLTVVDYSLVNLLVFSINTIAYGVFFIYICKLEKRIYK